MTRYNDGIRCIKPSPALIARMEAAKVPKYKRALRPVEAVAGGRRWTDIALCAMTFNVSVADVEGWIREGRFKYDKE